MDEPVASDSGKAAVTEHWMTPRQFIDFDYAGKVARGVAIVTHGKKPVYHVAFSHHFDAYIIHYAPVTEDEPPKSEDWDLLSEGKPFNILDNSHNLKLTWRTPQPAPASEPETAGEIVRDVDMDALMSQIETGYKSVNDPAAARAFIAALELQTRYESAQAENAALQRQLATAEGEIAKSQAHESLNRALLAEMKRTQEHDGKLIGELEGEVGRLRTACQQLIDSAPKKEPRTAGSIVTSEGWSFWYAAQRLKVVLEASQPLSGSEGGGNA